MYTIISFTATADLLTLVIEGVSQPTTVDLFDSANVRTSFTVPTSINGTQYTYSVAASCLDGIFWAVIDLDLITDQRLAIANLNTGATCLLNKVLNKKYDCLLLQELKATELYVKNTMVTQAKEVYNEVLLKCKSCNSTASELVENNIWIINDLYTK